MRDCVWVRVVAPHFVAGLAISRTTRRVVETAPILRWCMGKLATDVRREFDRRGWIAARAAKGGR